MTTRSIKASRKILLDTMTAQSQGKCVTRAARFSNDDVPKYLTKLKEFERTSKKAKFVVK